MLSKWFLIIAKPILTSTPNKTKKDRNVRMKSTPKTLKIVNFGTLPGVFFDNDEKNITMNKSEDGNR